MTAKKGATKKRSVKKSVSKTVPPQLTPFKPGNDPRRGKGPPKGQGGRPPDEFKARMRELVTRAAVEAELETVLSQKDHPQWLGALKYATEHGYGKAKETHEHSATGGLEAIILASLAK